MTGGAHGWRTLDVVLRVLLRDRYWSCEATGSQ